MQQADIEVLREQFNAAPDAVRVITLVSPTCLVCQYGAGVVRTMFELTPAPALKGFAVWVPMMSADNFEAAQRQAAGFADGRVVHLWDGERKVGDTFTKTLGLEGTAWDVYLLYAPGVHWDGSLPPAPTFWMHQLPSATGADADGLLAPRVFAERARTLLGGSATEVTTNMALLLHAKGLSAVRSDRPEQSLGEIGATAVGQLRPRTLAS